MNTVEIGYLPSLDYACSEAINTLCTNLSFAGSNVRKIMVTSSHASEGKSFTTMNIMRTMSKLGHSVALVDADLRRSELAMRHKLMFSPGSQGKGLAHYLAGMASMDDVIYRTNMRGCYFVPIGREVTNPLPLLVAPAFSQLLEHLTMNVELVLVDAPPVGLVIDAAEISRSCDATLIVVNYNTVHRKELIEVKRQLEKTGCPILGTVLNGVEYNSFMGRKYYYKSYNSGYYGEQKQTRSSKKQQSVNLTEKK